MTTIMIIEIQLKLLVDVPLPELFSSRKFNIHYTFPKIFSITLYIIIINNSRIKRKKFPFCAVM